MRALLPEPVEDVDVHAFYAADWVGPGGIRANMIASVDGAGAVEGRSKGLQTPGDNRVYSALRDLADVVLVAAGTAVAEGYAPVGIGPQRVAVRAAYGLPPLLPTAVVSRSLRGLDPADPLFADAAPDAPTLVLTTGAADPSVRAALSRTVELVECGAADLDLAGVRGALDERGLRRVLSEGGPTFLSALAAAGQLDELCLSITPLLAGPGATRILAGDPWPDGPRPLRLSGLLEEDGALFLRLRAR